MAFGRRVMTDFIEEYIDGIDFAIIADQVPPASWWRRFPFASRGIEVRGDPTQVEGWNHLEPYLGKIRYFSVLRVASGRDSSGGPI